MAARMTVRYFKRGIWLFEDKNAKPRNQEIKFTVINGSHIELIARAGDAILICDSLPHDEALNPVICSELHYLAKNQRGIFRLLAMYLRPTTCAYRIMANLAKMYEISL